MRTFAYVFASVVLAGFVAAPVLAKADLQTDAVDCSDGDSIQEAVNSADDPTTIFVSGICNEDASITKDDITLSGNEAGVDCIKATPGRHR